MIIKLYVIQIYILCTIGHCFVQYEFFSPCSNDLLNYKNCVRLFIKKKIIQLDITKLKLI